MLGHLHPRRDITRKPLYSAVTVVLTLLMLLSKDLLLTSHQVQDDVRLAVMLSFSFIGTVDISLMTMYSRRYFLRWIFFCDLIGTAAVVLISFFHYQIFSALCMLRAGRLIGILMSAQTCGEIILYEKTKHAEFVPAFLTTFMVSSSAFWAGWHVHMDATIAAWNAVRTALELILLTGASIVIHRQIIETEKLPGNTYLECIFPRCCTLYLSLKSCCTQDQNRSSLTARACARTHTYRSAYKHAHLRNKCESPHLILKNMYEYFTEGIPEVVAWLSKKHCVELVSRGIYCYQFTQHMRQRILLYFEEGEMGLGCLRWQPAATDEMSELERSNEAPRLEIDKITDIFPGAYATVFFNAESIDGNRCLTVTAKDGLDLHVYTESGMQRDTLIEALYSLLSSKGNIQVYFCERPVLIKSPIGVATITTHFVLHAFGCQDTRVKSLETIARKPKLHCDFTRHDTGSTFHGPYLFFLCTVSHQTSRALSPGYCLQLATPERPPSASGSSPAD